LLDRQNVFTLKRNRILYSVSPLCLQDKFERNCRGCWITGRCFQFVSSMRQTTNFWRDGIKTSPLLYTNNRSDAANLMYSELNFGNPCPF